MLPAADAAAAGVTGPVIALVALTNEPAANRLDTNGPTWVRTDGVVLWKQASDILTETPLAAISLLANGAPVAGGTISGLVWAGAESPSAFGEANRTCQNWTNGVFAGLSTSATSGDTSLVGPRYFSSRTIPCGFDLPVYCFEQ